MKPRPALGLTLGDPAGIGPELCVQAMRDPAVRAVCVPVLFADAGVLQRLGRELPTRRAAPSASARSAAHSRKAKATSSEVCRVVSLEEWEKGGPVKEPLIVDCGALAPASLRVGEVSAACGKAAFAYIRHAIRAAMAGRLAGVVTAPVHKQALRLAGVQYPGHTEIFAALTGARRTCMMLHSDVLTVSMATTHIGYAEVPGRLSAKRVLDVIDLTGDAVRRMRGRPARLGVCGLNPHAGERGLFGRRGEEWPQPACRRAWLVWAPGGGAVGATCGSDGATAGARRGRAPVAGCRVHPGPAKTIRRHRHPVP
jgi:4-phospho-D-threonate 3-dehydrogenase / 4-phospho-D-erythronate 3-dehydrogenase